MTTSILSRGFTQVLVVSFICFCCPGFFNALSGLGGAGSANASAADAANVALYVCFAISGCFGGMLFNLLGPNLLMGAGGSTYALYALASYLAGHDEAYELLFVLAGGLLGIGAGCLWTAQGAIIIAYAPIAKQGYYIAVFWVIFNLGGFFGALLSFFVNYSLVEEQSANPTSYFVFIGVMLVGSVLALFTLVSPSKVRREDGAQVVLERPKGPREEFTDVLSVFTSDKQMMCLAPLFFGSNFFYPFVFNGVNGSLFNVRTRGLNSALYWLAQMAGAIGLGRFLDYRRHSLARRGMLGFVSVIAFFALMYGAGAYLQFRYDGGYDRHALPVRIDFQDTRRAGFPTLCIILYGLGDSMVQSYCYWLMGALAANDTSKSARYSGFYKGVQSAGGAAAWALDMQQFNVPYSTQFLACCGIFIVALPSAYLVVKGLRESDMAPKREAEISDTLSA